MMLVKAGKTLNRDGHEHPTITIPEYANKWVEILNET